MTETAVPVLTPFRIPREGYQFMLRGLEAGLSLVATRRKGIEKGIRVPTMHGFLKWAHKTPDNVASYHRAKQQGIEARLDRQKERFNFLRAQALTMDPARVHALVSLAKLETDDARWEASKLVPRLYGDRLQHEHSGNVSIALTTGIPSRTLSEDLKDATFRELRGEEDSETVELPLQTRRVAEPEHRVDACGLLD